MALNDDQEKELKATHEKALKDAEAKFAAEKAEWEKNKKPDPKDEKDLADKARIEREELEKKSKYEKGLQSAIEFNHAAKDFMKTNASLVPKTVEGIFAAAEKEKYDSAIDKANAIKVGIFSEFFAVQANMDQLTGAQKIEVEEFLKLTKNGRQDRIESVYTMIFEPTLESIRKQEKAKQLNNGEKNQTDAEKAFADRMMKQSRKHYLGEKENA